MIWTSSCTKSAARSAWRAKVATAGPVSSSSETYTRSLPTRSSDSQRCGRGIIECAPRDTPRRTIRCQGTTRRSRTLQRRTLGLPFRTSTRSRLRKLVQARGSSRASRSRLRNAAKPLSLIILSSADEHYQFVVMAATARRQVTYNSISFRTAKTAHSLSIF